VLTAEDARVSLAAHVQAKGEEIRQKYGPTIGLAEVERILNDRACVRYPCRIVFDATPLEPGELAHPTPLGERPEDGFIMNVHPFLMTRLRDVPAVVLYQLVLVNYGPFVSPEDAESFGAAVLGISAEEYYATLCSMADEVLEDDGGCCP
jgi:hypothetical protein